MPSKHNFKLLIASVVLAPIFFWLSYNISVAYVGGDQKYYREFYEALSTTEAGNVPSVARELIGSVEPIAIYSLWAASRLGVEKDVFVSALNTLLLFLILRLSFKYNFGFIIAFLLCANFYVIVLLTGAERLKFAYILLLAFANTSGKFGRAFILISPLAHFQSLVLLASAALGCLADRFLRVVGDVRVKFTSVFITLIALTALLVIAFSYYDIILNKINIYFGVSKSAGEFANLSALLIVSLFVVKSKERFFFSIVPLFPAVLVFGQSRINMIAITVTVYFYIVDNRINHPISYIILLYLSIKSVPFLENVVLHGDGFAQ